jgi:hypothetical protein
MFYLFGHPFFLLLLSVAGFWFSAWLAASFHKRKPEVLEKVRDDLNLVLGATLTLLGLVIGFTFSMAVSRYDQRKNYEEGEANAIGTEYVRADFLPSQDAQKVRVLLKAYLEQRILHYRSRKEQELLQIEAKTALLQAEMWSTVASPTKSQATPIAALVASGMNDVLNSQGYTQAAWWNRIPTAAWALLILLSFLANILLGFSTHGRRPFLLLVLPITLSISLFLIADIDSPRRGVIRVYPQNLESLARSLRSR